MLRNSFFGRPFTVVLILWLLGASAAWGAEVTYLRPPAQVKRRGTTQWSRLEMGHQVRAGDRVRTGMGGRVELTISAKRQFRIAQATEIELQRLTEKPGRMRARNNLVLGRFWGSLRRPLARKGKEQFSVVTSTATIGVKGTTFGVDFEKDRTARVAVLTGQVTVQPPPPPPGPPKQVEGPREIAPPQQVGRADWSRLVSQDQKLIIRPGEKPETQPFTEADKQDPWVAFNIARDAQ